ncbi:rhodanese-like domain-containing protein [Modestobacter sp. KNN46-3]|jgi:rhodanese-related sulfurtransferase|uniref:rhodanese-like domain-containing protein n=1 Tax=Modestobacter sp. KNN46-3 TaxID=2711218 RepID=UPI0013DE7C40|nr:rhodanese-like domain-containing protein [Modestobacter sp. KNN46-3]
MTSPLRIAPDAVAAQLDDPVAPTLLDVRTPAEYETAHVPGSINVPLPLVHEHVETLAAALDGPVVLICQAGNRARTAHDALAAAGAEQLSVLDGGMNAHTAAGHPVRRGRRRWALERQVRLVVGGIVAGSVLASIRFPKARFLAGGIGAGLTLAAVTDSCAMGAALSALPYNRADQPVRLDDVLDVLRPATTGPARATANATANS